MDNHMHMLLDTLRIHLSNNGTNFSGTLAEEDADHITGFLLEDVSVNPSLPKNNMNEEINPLVELLYGEHKSQIRINRVQDHLERIEKKIRQLESRVPYTTEQGLLVGAAEVEPVQEEEDYYDEAGGSYGTPSTNKSLDENSEKKEEKQPPPPAKKSAKDGKHSKSSKGEAGHEENGDKKNCLTRLLFSKCWSGNQGKNNKAGWNLKNGQKPGRGKKGCPCGDEAPCAKIEKKTCPLYDKKCSGSKGKCAKKNKDDNALSSLCGKFCKAPCIFGKKNGEDGGKNSEDGGKNGEGKSGWRCGSCHRKKHVHTPCCCRCKDNPPLPKEKGGSRKSSMKRHSVDKMQTQNSSIQEHTRGSKSSQAQSADSNAEYYDAVGEEVASVHSAIVLSGNDGKDPTQETLRCVGCTDCDEIRQSSRDPKRRINQVIQSKGTPNLTKAKKNEHKNEPNGRMEVRSKSSTNLREDSPDLTKTLKKKEVAKVFKGKPELHSKSTTNLREKNPNLTKAMSKEVAEESKAKMGVISKSSTNMQVLLPPSISNESTTHNMVSHRILKTLSTIHGPIRVEQKIVVKGSKNAYVIVTHGEACECNICSTLKNDDITDKACDGGLEVVRFPTDNGCDTLVNHAEDCQCILCSVLGQGITEETPVMNMEKRPASVVWASWSKENLKTSDNRYSESMTQDFHTTADESKVCRLECSHCEGQSHAGAKKHCYKNREKSKKKKCHCSKCMKRRKVKRLKKKLKHVLEPSDLSEVLRELSHHGFTVEQDPEDDINQNGDEDTEENLRKESRTSNKKVSFSGDTKRLASTDSKDTVVSIESQCVNAKEPIATSKAEEIEQKRKTDNSRGFVYKCPQQKGEMKSFGNSKAAGPHSNNSIITDEPCNCIVCNGPYSNSTSRVTRTSKSKVLHYRPSRDEKQNCFPEKSGASSKCSCRKNKGESDHMREKIVDEVTHPDDDYIRPHTRCEPGCMGRCRFLTPRDEISRLANEHITPVVLQASRDKLSPKILYWIPSSPNLAAAFSSDSYYIPDIDEFPTSDRESRNTEQPAPYPSDRYQRQKGSHSQPGSACGTRRDRTKKHINPH